MSWTQKDWIDLLLMAIGAVFGVAFFGFGLAPLIGLEFNGGNPSSYMLASVAGTVGGYLLRFGTARLRRY